MGLKATSQSPEAALGTVTSVALSAASQFTVTGSPVTTSGTFTLAMAPQVGNLVWAGPANGSTAAPTFRALVNLDLTGISTLAALTSVGTLAALVATTPTFTSPTLGAATATTLGATGAITAKNATAITAGGGAGLGQAFLVSSTANFGLFFGSGAPTLAASAGSVYLNSTGSAVNNRMYVNDAGTAWIAFTTAG